MAVLVVHCGKGSGIHRKIGLHSIAEDLPVGTTVADALNGIDDEIPVAIFGSSRMIRSESFRTATRVPTHICVALGVVSFIHFLIPL